MLLNFPNINQFSQLKQPQYVYLNQKDGHSKVWGYYPLGQENSANLGFKVLVFWGRIGTNLQSQEKEFYNNYAAHDFVTSKIIEKCNKGYVEYSFDDYFRDCKDEFIQSLSERAYGKMTKTASHLFTKINLDEELNSI